MIEAPTLGVSVAEERASEPLADSVSTLGIVERSQLAAVGNRLDASNLASLFLLASRRAAINNAADVGGRLGNLPLKVDLAGDVVGSLDQSREVHVASRDVCVALALHRPNSVDAVSDFGRFVLQLLEIVHVSSYQAAACGVCDRSQPRTFDTDPCRCVPRKLLCAQIRCREHHTLGSGCNAVAQSR